jgi:acyl-CoA reductase-like NAD-dependent aldehyde dehydrogenase
MTNLHFYIDGAWQTPFGSDTIDVECASTQEPMGRVPAGTPEDVDRAVRAARRAFEGPWGRTSPADRAEWLARLAAALEQRVPDVARLIALEVGCPIRMSTSVQAREPADVTAGYASLAKTYAWQHEIGHSVVIREPYGVVAAITPWNYPLLQIMVKVAPALAAGCTVVLKPSELAPLNSYLLAEASLEIGLPAGVLNIVQGTGQVAGEALASHPGVDLVSFTGSVRAGRRVATLAAQDIKKVTLELGGKSAVVVLDDAPFERAIPNGVQNAMLNSGQTCSAWTRMIVPRSRRDEAIAIASKTLDAMPVGDPLDPATCLGPLISDAQRRRVEGYIAQGTEEGARLVRGGGRPAGLPRGYYVEPTIFADVDSRMVIAQEEIFGPVLSILTCDTEDEAVRIANDSVYGLAGGVWSGDPERAVAVARRIRTGQVDVNGGRFNPQAPFGGYKQSGIGREYGTYGLEEYLQIKAIAR